MVEGTVEIKIDKRISKQQMLEYALNLGHQYSPTLAILELTLYSMGTELKFDEIEKVLIELDSLIQNESV